MKGETEAEAQGARPPARVLIADDHDLVREGLLAVLEGEPDLEVVGEAKNGREALEMCRQMRPDLILMDVRMPEMDGLAATRAIKEELPTTSVVMVTMHENPDYLLEAIRAGAAGYLLKDAAGDRVGERVSEEKGRRYLKGGSVKLRCQEGLRRARQRSCGCWRRVGPTPRSHRSSTSAAGPSRSTCRTSSRSL